MSNQVLLSAFFEMGWAKLAPSFAKNILGIQNEIAIEATGSGDGSYN